MKFKFCLLGYILFFLDIILYILTTIVLAGVTILLLLGNITIILYGIGMFTSALTLLLANFLAPVAIQGLRASVEIEEEWENEKKGKDNYYGKQISK